MVINRLRRLKYDNQTLQYFNTIEASDCYVMDNYGKWCFIATNEQDYGLGPDFIENNH